MEEVIEFYLAESEAIHAKLYLVVPQIRKAVDEIVRCYKRGGKLLIFGNGGSAADAQHFAAEMVGRFQMERKSLPAIALTTNTSVLTAIGNDYGFEKIFERQVEGLATRKDLVIGISTSGDSQNVVNGIQKAKQLKIKTIALIGNNGKLNRIADIVIPVPTDNTPRIQEIHIFIIHIISELVERALFDKTKYKSGSETVDIIAPGFRIL